MKALILILIFINFVGCTFNKPTGPSFVPYSLKDENKALIYIYRPLGESHGYNRMYYLYNNGKKILDLKHGGYFPLEVEAGSVSLLSDVNIDEQFLSPNGISYYLFENPQSKSAFVEFEAEPKKIYYVRFKPITHFTYFEPTLSIVSKDEGLKEITNCKLIILENQVTTN